MTFAGRVDADDLLPSLLFNDRVSELDTLFLEVCDVRLQVVDGQDKPCPAPARSGPRAVRHRLGSGRLRASHDQLQIIVSQDGDYRSVLFSELGTERTVYDSSVDDDFVARVLELAVQARDRGNHPFGALLVVDENIVAEAHNRVNTDHDITAHAELMLVRQLEEGNRLELFAQGTVFASCEPCPMCVGAMFWAGVRRVVFVLSHSRLNELVRPPGGEPVGFTVSAAEIGQAAMPPMRFDGPHRQDDAAKPHVGFWR